MQEPLFKAPPKQARNAAKVDAQDVCGGVL